MRIPSSFSSSSYRLARPVTVAFDPTGVEGGQHDDKRNNFANPICTGYQLFRKPHSLGFICQYISVLFTH